MSQRVITRAPDPHAAPPVAIATRRDLFGTMGALLLLTAAEAGPAKAAELDGELLACCAEAHAIDQAADRWADLALAAPAGSAREQELWDLAQVGMPRFHDLAAQVTAIQPRTPEGLRAKAKLALSYTEEGGNHYDIAVAVLRDVCGSASA